MRKPPRAADPTQVRVRWAAGHVTRLYPVVVGFHVHRLILPGTGHPMRINHLSLSERMRPSAIRGCILQLQLLLVEWRIRSVDRMHLHLIVGGVKLFL